LGLGLGLGCGALQLTSRLRNVSIVV
jgi:hypothetical protein